jgi:hypothetical protein
MPRISIRTRQSHDCVLSGLAGLPDYLRGGFQPFRLQPSVRRSGAALGLPPPHNPSGWPARLPPAPIFVETFSPVSSHDFIPFPAPPNPFADYQRRGTTKPLLVVGLPVAGWELVTIGQQGGVFHGGGRGRCREMTANHGVSALPLKHGRMTGKCGRLSAFCELPAGGVTTLMALKELR